MLRRRHVVAAALAALLLAATPAAGATTKLMPGVRYTRDVRWSGGHRIVTHVVVAPRPGGLYTLRPILSNEALTGRETVSSMVRRLRRRGTAVAVNGDLFNWVSGRPTGMYLRRRRLISPPYPWRSSVGITASGLLRVARVSYRGSWRAGDLDAHPLAYFNHLPLDRRGVSLYTRDWGTRTPTGRRQVSVVVARFRRVRLGADVLGMVVGVTRGGGTVIPRGGAVLQARGDWARTLVHEATPGSQVSATVSLRPAWDAVRDALGGGPVLVENGRPIADAGEDFLASQTDPRNPRTAVGQRADGRIVFFAVDGRSDASAGLTVAGIARAMARLGCVRAMALDAGGSTTIVFNGKVLNRPSDGAERPVSDALALFYAGVYVPPPSRPVISPDGNGRGDDEQLAYRVVRHSTVRTKLVSTTGTIAGQATVEREPGRYGVSLVNPPLPDGRWRWVVSAIDRKGRRSSMSRSFRVNRTIAYLDVSPARLVVGVDPRERVYASFALERRSRVVVTVAHHGRVVRRLWDDALAAGTHKLHWSGRDDDGQPVAGGRYRLRVRATNRLGLYTRSQPVVVDRVR